MPYITKEQRNELSSVVFELQQNIISTTTPGELNYLITILILSYCDSKNLSYQHINDIVGALECAKQEFYRRVAAPYEETKIKQNGDVTVEY